MGKRTRNTGLTGLSHFVLQAFKNNSASQPLPESPVAATEESTQIQQLDNDPHGIGGQEPEAEHRHVKKRKLGKENVDQGFEREWVRSQWVEKYDATGLVPHYTQASEVPTHLKKYFSQRTRFLSLYSTPPGCLLDEEGWYSITPELVADQIAERCRCDTILDAFCGVGGNAIAFAKTCQRVIALDISPTRLALARHNAQIYGVADRIEFILTDYVSFANSYLSLPSSSSRKIDVVFLSPPWGGPSYLSGSPSTISGMKDSDVHPKYSLDSIRPIPGAPLFNLSRRITNNVAYYLPRNVSLEEVSALLPSKGTALSSELISTLPTAVELKGKEVVADNELIEVEEEWMGIKLKAVTCYFGGLVGGQEKLF